VFQGAIAALIVQTRLKLHVEPVSEVRGSGSVQLNDQTKAREAVRSGNLSLAGAGEHIRLNIAIETITTGGQRGIEGTHVHEGKHALDFAKMLSSFSLGENGAAYNPTAYQRELSAHITSAFYLMRRGGEYAEEGLSLGILSRRGGRISISPEGIRARLLNSYGLGRESQGATLDTAADPPIGPV